MQSVRRSVGIASLVLVLLCTSCATMGTQRSNVETLELFLRPLVIASVQTFLQSYPHLRPVILDVARVAEGSVTTEGRLTVSGLAAYLRSVIEDHVPPGPQRDGLMFLVNILAVVAQDKMDVAMQTTTFPTLYLWGWMKQGAQA